MADSSNLPATRPLDRAALERVLARAAELQARESDPGEGTLTEEQLLEIGKEVGLAPENIRQALAEERTRIEVARESGVLASAFGARRVFARRTVPGAPDAVMSMLDAWMQREECLQVKRRFPDRVLWEKRPGFLSDVRRAFNVGGRGYHLARAHEVGAAVVPVDAGRSLVHLEADLSNIRGEHVAAGAVSVLLGAAGVGVVLMLPFLPVVAALPAAVGLTGGVVAARTYGPAAARIQLALEQVLDRLERGEMPRPTLPGIISALATGRLMP